MIEAIASTFMLVVSGLFFVFSFFYFLNALDNDERHK